MNTLKNMRNTAFALLATASIANAQSTKLNKALTSPELLNVKDGISVVSTSSEFRNGQMRMPTFIVGYQSKADTSTITYLSGRDKDLNGSLSPSEVSEAQIVTKTLKTLGGKGKNPVTTRALTTTETFTSNSRILVTTQHVPEGPVIDPARHTPRIDKLTGKPMIKPAFDKQIGKSELTPRDGNVLSEPAISALFLVAPL